MSSHRRTYAPWLVTAMGSKELVRGSAAHVNHGITVHEKIHPEYAFKCISYMYVSMYFQKISSSLL